MKGIAILARWTASVASGTIAAFCYSVTVLAIAGESSQRIYASSGDYPYFPGDPPFLDIALIISIIGVISTIGAYLAAPNTDFRFGFKLALAILGSCQ